MGDWQNIVFEDRQRKVYLPKTDKNGDLFILNKQTGVTIRISTDHVATTTTIHRTFEHGEKTAVLVPGAVRGLSAFHATNL